MGWWRDLLRSLRRKRAPAPSPPPFDAVGAEATCRAIWREELGREIDPDGLAGCLNQARAGGTAETIRANVRSSDEYQQRSQVPERPVLSRLHVDGRYFVDGDGATFRPVFASALSILVQPADRRAAVLNEIAALGFNGIRVFAGRLTWAGQTPEISRSILPTVVNDAADRGLRVLVTAITDSRDGGYDEADHLDRIADLTAGFDNILLEVANETYHPTQSELVNDARRLLELAELALVGYPHPWALGAASVDEPINGLYPNDGGRFNTSHLDRGRDKWNQVRRVREIFAITEVTGRPALNSEPIGAAEVVIPGKRENDPHFFFALGALNRCFDVGGVFHSEDGLHAQTLGPVQRTCAEAFIAGSRIVPWDTRLSYRNVGHVGSPIKSADLQNEQNPQGELVRAYSFIDGTRGVAVILSHTERPSLSTLQFTDSWLVVEELARRPHVTVLRLTQAG